MKIKNMHLGIAVRLHTNETVQFVESEKMMLDITFEQGIFWIRSKGRPGITCVTIQNVRGFTPMEDPLAVTEAEVEKKSPKAK